MHMVSSKMVNCFVKTIILKVIKGEKTNRLWQLLTNSHPIFVCDIRKCWKLQWIITFDNFRKFWKSLRVYYLRNHLFSKLTLKEPKIFTSLWGKHGWRTIFGTIGNKAYLTALKTVKNWRNGPVLERIFRCKIGLKT